MIGNVGGAAVSHCRVEVDRSSALYCTHGLLRCVHKCCDFVDEYVHFEEKETVDSEADCELFNILLLYYWL